MTSYVTHLQFAKGELAVKQIVVTIRPLQAIFLASVDKPKGLLIWSLHIRKQRVTGIPVPGNFRENQFNVFPLDLEKSFSISRSRLETRD